MSRDKIDLFQRRFLHSEFVSLSVVKSLALGIRDAIPEVTVIAAG